MPSTNLALVSDDEIVGATMQYILDGIVEAFAEANVDLPDRQFLLIGPSAHDCEQLVISFMQMYAGAPGDRPTEPVRCNSPRSAVLVVQLVRCVPAPEGRTTPPSAEALTESTLSKTRDAWLLLTAVLAMTDQMLGALADVSVTQEKGGFQAVVLNLTVGIP